MRRCAIVALFIAACFIGATHAAGFDGASSGLDAAQALKANLTAAGAGAFNSAAATAHSARDAARAAATAKLASKLANTTSPFGQVVRGAQLGANLAAYSAYDGAINAIGVVGSNIRVAASGAIGMAKYAQKQAHTVLDKALSHVGLNGTVTAVSDAVKGVFGGVRSAAIDTAMSKANSTMSVGMRALGGHQVAA